jgi:hypothetical protein
MIFVSRQYNATRKETQTTHKQRKKKKEKKKSAITQNRNRAPIELWEENVSMDEMIVCID